MGTLSNQQLVNLLSSPAMSGAGTTGKIFSDAAATLQTQFGEDLTYHYEFPQNVGDYTFSTMTGMAPPASRVNDYQVPPLSTIPVQGTKRFSTVTFGTSQAISDKLLKTSIKSPTSLRDMYVKELANSIHLTEENDFIAILIYARTSVTTSMPAQLGVLGDDVDLFCADGKPLFASSADPHTFPNSDATNYNLLPLTGGPSVDILNKVNTAAGQFVNSQNIPYGFEARDIWSPTNQAVYWNVVRKSAGDPSSANRGDNPVKHMNLGVVKTINRLPDGVPIFTTSALEKDAMNYKIQRVRMGGVNQYNVVAQDRRCVTYFAVVEMRFQTPHQFGGYIALS